MDITTYFTKEELEIGSNFIILVGPPGAGKSSFAKKVAESDDSWIIISPDEIRAEIAGNASDQSKNVDVFKIIYNDLETYLDEGRNVIYDATNCRAIYRIKILSAVKSYAKKCVCFVSSASISDCFAQNNARDRVVPEDVIERMYFTLKKHPPTLNEGYDIIAKF